MDYQYQLTSISVTVETNSINIQRSLAKMFGQHSILCRAIDKFFFFVFYFLPGASAAFQLNPPRLIELNGNWIERVANCVSVSVGVGVCHLKLTLWPIKSHHPLDSQNKNERKHKPK